jgi:predicted PurR-regulated permease PerM
MEFNFLILTKKELLQLIASFIAGLILGAALLNLWIGRELDQLIYERNQLIGQLNTQQTELKKLKESLQEHKRTVVQEVKIELNDDLDKHIQQELEEKIFSLLNNLIGKQLSEIDTNMLADSLNERTIIIEDKQYTLDLLWIILKTTTTIKCNVKSED